MTAILSTFNKWKFSNACSNVEKLYKIPVIGVVSAVALPTWKKHTQHLIFLSLILSTQPTLQSVDQDTANKLAKNGQKENSKKRGKSELIEVQR